MANSKVYGYYGSVYVPPSSVPYVPQPPTVRFTEEHRQKLEQLIAQTQFYAQSAASILIRTPGLDANTFVLTTSGAPEKAIIVNADENMIDGGFANPNYTAEMLIDGGNSSTNVARLTVDGGIANTDTQLILDAGPAQNTYNEIIIDGGTATT
jgi:hypothetical protein